jgi:hypothetical protein
MGNQSLAVVTIHSFGGAGAPAIVERSGKAALTSVTSGSRTSKSFSLDSRAQPFYVAENLLGSPR